MAVARVASGNLCPAEQAQLELLLSGSVFNFRYWLVLTTQLEQLFVVEFNQQDVLSIHSND